ncbi:hypothetical protein D3C86_1814390 [compost metagenome]
MVDSECREAKPNDNQEARRDVPSGHEHGKKRFPFTLCSPLLALFRRLQRFMHFVMDVFVCQIPVTHGHRPRDLYRLPENILAVLMFRRPLAPFRAIFGAFTFRPASECGVFEQ